MAAAGLPRSMFTPTFAVSRTHRLGHPRRRAGRRGQADPPQLPLRRRTALSDRPRAGRLLSAGRRDPTLGAMGRPTRWVTETKPGHSQWYIERFRTMAAEGADLGGEARLVDAMVRAAARECSTPGAGRAGRRRAPRARPHGRRRRRRSRADRRRRGRPPRSPLARRRPGRPRPAGDGRARAVRRAPCWPATSWCSSRPGPRPTCCAASPPTSCPTGFVVTGFHTNRDLPLARFDECVGEAGLRVEHRFATWDLRAWHDGADFAVTVLRHR